MDLAHRSPGDMFYYVDRLPDGEMMRPHLCRLGLFSLTGYRWLIAQA
jgi:hypothetical protein